MTEYSNAKSVLRRHFRLTPTRTIMIGFLVIILIGTFLLSLPISNSDNAWLPFIDSFFTATSAVCVTGLVVRDTGVQFSLFGQVVILFLIQIGGLGFMTVATVVFMLMGRKITLRERLAIKESLVEFKLQGVVKLIRSIIIMTLVIEAVGAILLMFSFIPAYGAKGIYLSIFHSVSAFCNAGFDLLGTLEAPFQGYSVFATNVMACLPLLMLIVTGGLGFTVLRDLISTRKWSKLSIHSKVVLTMSGLLIFTGFIFFFLAEYNNALTIGNMNFGEKILASLFQAITPRTAGFSTIAQSELTNASKLFTSVMMFIGASPGSTGGGVKTTVIFVIIVVVASNFKGRNKVVVDLHEIPSVRVMKAVSIVVFASLLIITSSILLMLFEQGNNSLTMESLFFEAVSAFGTVGLSYGITPELSTLSKIVVIVTMFLGRVGPLTVGFAIVASSGLGVNNNIKFSEAKILVG